MIIKPIEPELTATMMHLCFLENETIRDEVPDGYETKDLLKYVNGSECFGFYRDDQLIGCAHIKGNDFHVAMRKKFIGYGLEGIKNVLSRGFKGRSHLNALIGNQNTRTIELAQHLGFKPVNVDDKYTLLRLDHE